MRRNPFAVYLLTAFAFMVAVAIANPLLGILHTFPDAGLYSRAIQRTQTIDHLGIGVYNFTRATYLFNVLSGGNVVIFVVWSLMCLYLVALIAPASVQMQVSLFMLVSMAWPAFVVFCTLPLREYFIVMAVIMLFYFFKTGKLAWLMISVLSVYCVRPQFLPLWPLAIAARFIPSGTFGVLALVSSVPAIAFFEFLYGHDVTPEELMSIHSSWAEQTPSAVYYAGPLVSMLDIVTSMPALVLQFLLSPLPILHSQGVGTGLIFLSDLMYVIGVYGITIFMLIKRRKVIFSDDGYVALRFLVFIGLLLVSASLWEGFIGGAVRHRIPVVAGLMMFCIEIELLYRRG